MKNIFVFSIITIVLSSLIGCSQNCHDTYVLSSFEVYNSENLSSIDDIVINAYQNDRTFTVLIDSFKIKEIKKIEDLQFECQLNKSLDPNFDYDFYFIKSKVLRRITGIKIKKEKCKDGIFVDDYSYSFDGYYVNGNLFMCNIIKVFD